VERATILHKEETKMRIRAMTLTAGALSLGLLTTAQGMPLTNSAAGLKAAADGTVLVEHVDACNRVCRKAAVPEWGGAVRWHRHVGKACRPVKCSP
jgi:hypothetical protein